MPTHLEAAIGILILLVLALVVLQLRRPRHEANLEQIPRLKEGVDQNLPQINQVTTQIQSAVGEAHKSLAAITATTQATPDIAKAVAAIQTDIRRLEALERDLARLTKRFVSAGGKGRLGEDAVQAIFENAPKDLWKSQWKCGSGIVDFAAKMPNGLWLPIDSKTSGVGPVTEYLGLSEQLAVAEDTDARKTAEARLSTVRTRLAVAVLGQSGKVAHYIDPEGGTLGLAIQAVPEGVYDALDPATLQKASAQRVHVVPYALLPPVIDVLRSQNEFGALDLSTVVSALQSVRKHTDAIQKTVENKVRRAATMLQTGATEIEGDVLGIAASMRLVESQDGPHNTTASVAKQASRQQP